MTRFPGFTADDFAGFRLPSLDERMAFIKSGPRPKLEALGADLTPFLTELTGQPVYPITAKHLRRKVNPPDDTWVAWSANKRGYKMLPHFQVGLWHTHAFIQAGLIYEAEARAAFATNLLKHGRAIQSALPPHFRWLEDYTRPEGIPNREMTAADFHRIAERLTTKKEADCMAGLSVPADEAVRLGAGFADLTRTVMTQLLPIYNLAR
ncbi:MAG TPA: DUF1054 family protein [Symbiobacteriaceae bacterium]|nr:DUF1054 family protein [Symbiobacteriaceae bacterium]